MYVNPYHSGRVRVREFVAIRTMITMITIVTSPNAVCTRKHANYFTFIIQLHFHSNPIK